MNREPLRINRFGFAEYQDMIAISRRLDSPELAGVLKSVVELVLSEESDLLDSISDGAQADFVVPLGMAARLLSSADYSVMELVSAACTVRYSADPHMSEFPRGLVELLSRLPR
jgi:hypothetical protein